MSTTLVRRSLAHATATVRTAPLFWGAFGIAQILLIWGQNLIPIAGTFLASVLSVALVARLFSRNWFRRAGPLFWMGLLHFPLTAAWPVLESFHRNAGWFETFSLAWTLPLLFLLSIGELTMAGTIREILRGNGVDRSIALAWRDLASRAREVFLIAALGCVLLTLGFETRGAGFFVVAPFALAFLRDFSTADRSPEDGPPASREPTTSI